MAPGSVMAKPAVKPSTRSWRCPSGSFGPPVVWPSGRSTKAVRGGLALAVIDLADEKPKVGNPPASRWRAIRPTDW